MRPVQRIQPRLPVRLMQTFKVSRPLATHTRPATCEEVQCPDFINGYQVRLPFADDRITLLKAAAYGRVDGMQRAIHEVTCIGDAERTFILSGPCLKATTHRVSLERPENYLVRGGDWRANTGLIRRHTRPELWVEDMSETFDAVRRRIEG